MSYADGEAMSGPDDDPTDAEIIAALRVVERATDGLKLWAHNLGLPMTFVAMRLGGAGTLRVEVQAAVRCFEGLTPGRHNHSNLSFASTDAARTAITAAVAHLQRKGKA